MDFWIQENEKQQDFTGEEIASFKRYIEENDVYNDNTFEFTERNLDYFSARYTRDDFTCYAELFHVNSDFWNSDEMDENIELYESQCDLELKHDLELALDILSLEEREIVSLSVFCGYNSNEIGEILQIKPATARSKLSRALAKMQRKMKVQF